MAGVDCRAGWWPACAAFAIDSFFASIAFDIHLEDGGVMDEPIDCGERHGLAGEDFAPFAEGLIGGDQDGSAFVAGGDELEEHAGFSLVLGNIGEVVEDQQVIFVELVDRGFEAEIASCELEPLNEIGGASKENTVAVLDQREAQGGREMGLAAGPTLR